jgi:hypothetical protein
VKSREAWERFRANLFPACGGRLAEVSRAKRAMAWGALRGKDPYHLGGGAARHGKPAVEQLV